VYGDTTFAMRAVAIEEMRRRRKIGLFSPFPLGEISW
jgi:hypothetical protein